MKASYRSSLRAAAAATALAVTVTPSVASAQRQVTPDRKVLVTTFRGDVEGGVRVADEIRNRISSDFNARTLAPNSKKDIDNTLQQSGYKPDSALNPNDIKELAKLVRADEIIDGTVTKTANGYRVNARLFLPRDAALSQPLISTESSNLGDVARQIVREYDAARKQLQANQACENAIRDRKYDVAIAEARKGIATYPKATLSRLCLASAFQQWKTTADSTRGWADSVISVTRDIEAIDKQSKIAYTLAYDAYKTKNDSANALRSLVGMMNADPTNSTLREQVIAELVQSGKADIAVPTAKQLVADNPGDPQYARTYWLVLRAARNYKESVPAGQAYVGLDAAAADSNYYFRQVADLRADSAFARAAEFASQGIAKFPRSGTLYLQKANNELSAGQIPAAKASLQRALELDPKLPGANLLLARLEAESGNTAGAIAAVQRDVTTDATNKDRDAAYLLQLGNTAYRAGVASKKDEDYQRAITLLKASDAINPSDNAKFLTGVSAFSLLQKSAQELQTAKSCPAARQASEYLTLTTTNVGLGGKTNPDAAKQILGATGQYQTFIDASVKRYCK